MDYLKDDFKQLKPTVSAQDAQRLEEHVDQITALEKDLRRPAAQCDFEGGDGGIDWTSSRQMVRNCDFKFKQLGRRACLRPHQGRHPPIWRRPGQRVCGPPGLVRVMAWVLPYGRQ